MTKVEMLSITIVHVFSIDSQLFLKTMLLYDVISEVECFFILYYLLCKFALVLLVTLISPFDKT